MATSFPVQASDYLKAENYSIFLQDLDHRHRDLLFTKSHLISTNYANDSEEKDEDPSGDSGYSAISLENIDSFIRETDIMMHSLKARITQEKSAHEKLKSRTFSLDSMCYCFSVVFFFFSIFFFVFLLEPFDLPNRRSGIRSQAKSKVIARGGFFPPLSLSFSDKRN